MVVIGLLPWIENLMADRFTAPYGLIIYFPLSPFNSLEPQAVVGYAVSD